MPLLPPLGRAISADPSVCDPFAVVTTIWMLSAARGISRPLLAVRWGHVKANCMLPTARVTGLPLVETCFELLPQPERNEMATTNVSRVVIRPMLNLSANQRSLIADLRKNSTEPIIIHASPSTPRSNGAFYLKYFTNTNLTYHDFRFRWARQGGL